MDEELMRSIDFIEGNENKRWVIKHALWHSNLRVLSWGGVVWARVKVW
jgi:hypothetical protein